MAVTAGPATLSPRSPGGSLQWIAAGASTLTVIAFIIVAALVGVQGAILGTGNQAVAGGPSDGISTLARAEIPLRYLGLYRRAARRYALDWAFLAAIGKVECDHGRDPDPSCTHEGAVNSAGAGGPMQFIATTWARYGMDGDGDGRIDRWDAADAIYSAANYLRASGAPRNYRAALWAYNHAGWYVAAVESWAARYRGAERSPRSLLAPEGSGEVAGEGDESAAPVMSLAHESTTPVQFVAGERAALTPGEGHLALVPAGAPAAVQAMVVAGNELQDLPYGPGGHPDPRGAYQEDCSSTVNYVLYRSGVRPIGEIVRANPLAQDYVHWGAAGPGRWVSIYATATHVFIVIAHIRLDTSRSGTDVGPNRNQDGPRWRILDRIPTWAHWSIRHPSGM
jgi:hypothetical protein